MIHSQDVLIGKTLGTCRLEQQIGRGGMSVVYLAQQTRPYRKVAVKILLPNVPASSQVHDDFLARFLREADVIARLEHNHIVRIYECNLQDGLAYLVMPYLAGGNLARLLLHHRALTLQEASKYITEAAAALDYAHSHGIIHRDLKPSNFLLQEDGHLVLADFGIAYMMRDRNSPRRATLTISGTVLGTPDYMAPEMTSGSEMIDHRVDIYELGIMLYQMLSGDVPFKGHTPVETMLKHSQEPLPHLYNLNPSIPPSVDAVVQKAAAKDREDRYSSAGEFALALERAIREPRYPASHYIPTIPVPGPSSSPADPTIPVSSGNTMESPNRYTTTMPQTVAAPPAMPQKSVQPAKSSHRKFALIAPLIALVVGLIFTGVYVGFAQHSPPATPVKTTILTQPAQQAQQAQQAVQRYYGDIDQHNYPAAFQLATSTYTGGNYHRFTNTFAFTESDKVSFDGAPEQHSNEFNVPIILHTVEEAADGTWQTTYQGYETVEKVNNAWLIAGGQLSETKRVITTDPTPSIAPTQAGQAVMQRYYDDINRRDYPAAYNLWGSAFHQSRDYYNFVTGYSQTVHNAISFGNIVQQNNGTVLVPMTIQATAQSASGTQVTTSTYQAIYTVGQENGQWKIVQETMQKV